MTPSDLLEAISKIACLLDTLDKHSISYENMRAQLSFLLGVQQKQAQLVDATFTSKRTEESHYRYYGPDCIIPSAGNSPKWYLVINGRVYPVPYINETLAITHLKRFQKA